MSIRPPSGNKPVLRWPKVRKRPRWKAWATRAWSYLTAPIYKADEVEARLREYARARHTGECYVDHEREGS